MSNRPLARAAVLGLLAATAACVRGRVPEGPPGAPAPARAGGRSPGPPQNGLEVIGWMRYAHPSRDLTSLTFGVSTTEYRADSSRIVRAIVYASLPGKTRVTQLPTSSRTGHVRDRHRLAVFERGQRVMTSSQVDVASLLAFDVFAQSVDTTIMWLDSSAVRYGIVRGDVLDGRDVWVVGAMAGDTTSAQFWVDAARWRVVRVIQRDPRTPRENTDIRFTEFRELLDVPVPIRIEVRRGGRVVQRQEVGDVVVNPGIPSRAFDLARWRDIRMP